MLIEIILLLFKKGSKETILKNKHKGNHPRILISFQERLWKEFDIMNTIYKEKDGYLTMAGIQFEIIQTIKVLSEGNKGWRKELNIISWNGRQAKYDIRDWSENHEKMGKGVTFTAEELQELAIALEDVPPLD